MDLSNLLAGRTQTMGVNIIRLRRSRKQAFEFYDEQ